MLDQFPSGQSCFIDANILTYALVDFEPLTSRCRAFLNRVSAGEVQACTSAGTVADALYKTMIIEAAHRFAPAGIKPLSYLQHHPEVISQLTHYPAAAEALSQLPLPLLEIDWENIVMGIRTGVQQKLLTNDSIIIALMQRRQISHLVTNDDDFDYVPAITVWKPR